jgi:hypothetical protein
MKFRIELMAVVDVEYEPLRYGPGVPPDVALSLELDRASRDPGELLRGREFAVQAHGSIVGAPARPGRQSLLDRTPRARH